MASTIQRTTKSGQIFYEIQVSRGRGRSKLTKRWYPPDGWGKRAIDRELNKVAADFERQVNDGEIISRTEQQELDLQQKREAAKVLTLREYGETVFMPAKTVTISENSRCSFQSNLDNHIYPALGDLKMPDITPANISALLLSIQSQGRKHSTVVKVYTILNMSTKRSHVRRVCISSNMGTQLAASGKNKPPMLSLAGIPSFCVVSDRSASHIGKQTVSISVHCSVSIQNIPLSRLV